MLKLYKSSLRYHRISANVVPFVRAEKPCCLGGNFFVSGKSELADQRLVCGIQRLVYMAQHTAPCVLVSINRNSALSAMEAMGNTERRLVYGNPG